MHVVLLFSILVKTDHLFIAPSHPFQGDQAVDPHATRAQPPPNSGGRVWSIVPCVSRGDDRALLGLWGGEAEETMAGHRERGERGRGERRRREEKRRG